MSTAPDKSSQTLFDSLISELLNSDQSKSLIDICMSGNQKSIKSIPLRYRIIALGFTKKYNLKELNETLNENGCEQLYARSLFEATLIYSFSNGLSYEEWKKISIDALSLRDRISSDSFLSEKKLSLKDIRNYVMNNSVYDNELAITLQRTKMMKAELSDLDMKQPNFFNYLLSNIASFCTYREKSRYYFCKYLMYYLDCYKEKYLQDIRNGSDWKKAVKTLIPFRAATALTRNKYTDKDADELIQTVPISLGAIYNEFQNFYFEYTSMDWMDVLLEKYGDIDRLSAKQKETLASYIRKYNKSKYNLSTQEILDWQKQELEKRESQLDKEMSYQTNRGGENFLRKVLRGELDLDRTTLMAFLVFFDSNSKVPEEHRVDLNRLNAILSECGFPEIDAEKYVDEFFASYMTKDDPITYLIEEAEIMAMSEENFHLYKTHLNSKSSEAQWHRLIT